MDPVHDAPHAFGGGVDDNYDKQGIIGGRIPLQTSDNGVDQVFGRFGDGVDIPHHVHNVFRSEQVRAHQDHTDKNNERCK